ncbi:hypothetical protein FHT44_005049 [Mycolicibacterium sp. BK634]|uniref:hypothetical protein n=1 Tax=Mycolicibacterium sp. BK634 TaxID=2587099 RepID=UPI00161B60BF|nr:hypothetical protein [Mycolicibacterium sp. BK634]MBB3752537.1 hypothetical protein [Mycolicibacterium sp. BK634]
MTLALTIIGLVMTYAFCGGVVGMAFYRARMKACPKCSKGYSCSTEHDAAGVGAGLLWPLTVPVVSGVVTTNWFAQKENRAERREKRKRAEHARRMDEIEAQRVATLEAIKLCEQYGIKAGVPGLYELGKTA